MENYASDSRDEPVQYVRRTPRRPGSSRRVSLETDSSDQSPDCRQLKAGISAGQTPSISSSSHTGDLIGAAAAAASAGVTGGSVQHWSGSTRPHSSSVAWRKSAHSLRAEERSRITPPAELSCKVRRISSQSSEGEDVPLTFSRSVPQPRAQRSALAHSDSSSDAGCDTFKRSVPRRSRRPVLPESSGTDSPLPRPQSRQHALRELPSASIPSGAPMALGAQAAGGMPSFAQSPSNSSRQPADSVEALAACLDGLPTLVSSGCSGAHPEEADSVAAQLAQLMLRSDAGGADATRLNSASLKAMRRGSSEPDKAVASSGGKETCIDAQRAVRPAQAAVTDALQTVGSGLVDGTAVSPAARSGAEGASETVLESASEPDSSPCAGTARRSIRIARRDMLADSESEASPGPANAQVPHQRPCAPLCPVNSNRKGPALSPVATGSGSPFVSGKATPPPEWMTTSRRLARPPADGPLGVLCPPAPRAISFQTPGADPAATVVDVREGEGPPPPQQPPLTPEHRACETPPTPDGAGWLARGDSPLEQMQLHGVCGQATPVQGLKKTEPSVVRSACAHVCRAASLHTGPLRSAPQGLFWHAPCTLPRCSPPPAVRTL